MRPKSLALLLLALGCGLIASIGITQVMAKRTADPVVGPLETEPVFVALKDIPVGEPLTPELLKIEQWPKDRVPAGALSKLEEVEGLRPRAKLYAGEPILKNKLFGKGNGEPGASPQIPKGFRVVSVKVDAVSGASSLIVPGDRVDLLAHLLQNPAAGINEPTTRTVLQNVKVFAVDAVVNVENMEGDGSSAIPAKTISLLVTPEQAQKVTLATELGQVRLVLRSPEDDQDAEVAGVSPRELFGKAAANSRDKEMGAEAPKSAEAKGFLELLQATMNDKPSKGGEAAGGASSDKPDRHVMRLLKGAQSNEVVLEADSSRPDGFWRSSEDDAAAMADTASNVQPPVLGAPADEPPAAAAPPQSSKAAAGGNGKSAGAKGGGDPSAARPSEPAGDASKAKSRFRAKPKEKAEAATAAH